MSTLLHLILLLGPAGMATAPADALPERRPNLVLFLVDDLGWADTGAYGSTFYETPHTDRLAAEGVRFTRFYSASPVCSPTRASPEIADELRENLDAWRGQIDARMPSPNPEWSPPPPVARAPPGQPSTLP